ncbi:phage tail sheath family protein [Archangium violaceum]|uniref:phage tail sheath family protein n=1 Tax=Archangium violaceum TaxID=83451 RepID=UPI0013629E9C|nr:phage tail sheath subtilisin-like domain-containing protein [Archangium violaceum]
MNLAPVEERPPAGVLRTGVPAFLAFTQGPAPLDWKQLTRPGQLEAWWKDAPLYLACAVRGFFENGGEQCWVVPLGKGRTLEQGLATLKDEEDVDLVCGPCLLPDSAGVDELAAAQARLLRFCGERGDCFALLDSPQGADERDMLSGPSSFKTYKDTLLGQLADAPELLGLGALYYPWIQVSRSDGRGLAFVPPCGHLAGTYARTDRRAGVHKAPANELLEGALDVEHALARPEALNSQGINGLRALPGRGIRAFGARTLSAARDWRYLNVRRLFLTLRRWLVRTMAWVTFEPHDLRLWVRVRRELTGHLEKLYLGGAFQGTTPEEAFYVKCDAENNPPASREQGRLVVELGLAPATPREFIVIHLIHDAAGTAVVTPG